MSEADWYEIAQGDDLVQGDILFRCPVFVVTSELKWPLTSDPAVRIAAEVFDLVIMSQSCDREHLAQAFARYFMRVGLPHDAKTFEKEGDVQVP